MYKYNVFIWYLDFKTNQQASLCSYQPEPKGDLVKHFPRPCSRRKRLRLLSIYEK